MEGALRSKQDAFLCPGPEGDNVGESPVGGGGQGRRGLWVGMTKGQMEQDSLHCVGPDRVEW